MTKKDFILIAKALSQAEREARTAAERKGVRSAIEHISHALEVTNPRFDGLRFQTYIAQMTLTGR